MQYMIVIGIFISFHYEHFSAQVNIHRKCANVTVHLSNKNVLSNFLKVFAQRRILQSGRQIIPDCGTRDLERPWSECHSLGSWNV